MPRVRFEFSKGDQVRFLSHLDLMKTFERAVRRAKIPIAFSEGFNPHPKMNFASALAVGVVSEHEFMDMELTHETDLKELTAVFASAFPPGIKINQARFVPDNAPALMASVNRADYEVSAETADRVDRDLLHNHISRFLGSGEIMITKRTKKGMRQKDIRPGILEFKGVSDGDKIMFLVSVVISNEGNVRPEEVVCSFKEHSGLPVDCETLYIKRTGLFVERKGEMLSPMEL